MRVLECILALALLTASCGKKDEPPKKEPAGHAHEHGPNGGEILELGGGAAHLEIIHDHEGGNMTVFVLGADMKTPIAVEPPLVNLEKGPVQLTLTPIDPLADGTAVSFKGSHEGLKADPWLGRIVVKIGGKPYQSPLEGEGHDHDHK